MNVKLCISGKIASGKTSLAKSLSQYFGFHVVSFGNIIRESLRKLGIEPTRGILHEKSRAIVASVGNYGAMDWFIANSSQIDWNDSLIIEGCRHPETYQRLRELFPFCLLVHCSCPENIQIDRIMKRDNLPINKIREIISCPIEEDLDSEFIKVADIVNFENTKQTNVIKELELLLQNNSKSAPYNNMNEWR